MTIRIDGDFFDVDTAPGDVLDNLKDLLHADEINYLGFGRIAEGAIGRVYSNEESREPETMRALISGSFDRHAYSPEGVLWALGPDNTPGIVDPNDYTAIPMRLGPDAGDPTDLNRHGWTYFFGMAYDNLDITNASDRLRAVQTGGGTNYDDIEMMFTPKRAIRGELGADYIFELREIPLPTAPNKQEYMVGMGANGRNLLLILERSSGGATTLETYIQDSRAGTITPLVSGTFADAEVWLDVRFEWNPVAAQVTVRTNSAVQGEQDLGTMSLTYGVEAVAAFSTATFTPFDSNSVLNLGLREPERRTDRDAVSVADSVVLRALESQRYTEYVGVFDHIHASWLRRGPTPSTNTPWENLVVGHPLFGNDTPQYTRKAQNGAMLSAAGLFSWVGPPIAGPLDYMNSGLDSALHLINKPNTDDLWTVSPGAGFSAVVQPNTHAVAKRPLFTYYNSTGNWNNFYAAYIETDDKLYVRLAECTTAGCGAFQFHAYFEFDLPSVPGYDKTAWNIFAISFDGTEPVDTDRVTVWLNGQNLDAYKTLGYHVAGTMYTAIGGFNAWDARVQVRVDLMGKPNAVVSPFGGTGESVSVTGKWGQCRVWKRALTQADVDHLYAEGAGNASHLTGAFATDMVIELLIPQATTTNATIANTATDPASKDYKTHNLKAIDIQQTTLAGGTPERSMIHWANLVDRSHAELQDLPSDFARYDAALFPYNFPLPDTTDEDDVFIGNPAISGRTICLPFSAKLPVGADPLEGIFLLDFVMDCLVRIGTNGVSLDPAGIGSRMFHGAMFAPPTTYLSATYRTPPVIRGNTPAYDQPAVVHSVAPGAAQVDSAGLGWAALTTMAPKVFADKLGTLPAFAFQISYADMGAILVSGYTSLFTMIPPVGLQQDGRRTGLTGFTAGAPGGGGHEETAGPMYDGDSLAGADLAPLGIPSLWHTNGGTPPVRFGGTPIQGDFPYITPFHQIPGWFFFTPVTMPSALYEFLGTQILASQGLTFEESLERLYGETWGEYRLNPPGPMGSLVFLNNIGFHLALGIGQSLEVQAYAEVFASGTTDAAVTAAGIFTAPSAVFDTSSVNRYVRIATAPEAGTYRIVRYISGAVVELDGAFTGTGSLTWDYVHSVYEIVYDSDGRDASVAAWNLFRGTTGALEMASGPLGNFYRVTAARAGSGDAEIILTLEPVLLSGESALTFAITVPGTSGVFVPMPWPWSLDVGGIPTRCIPVSRSRATDLTGETDFRYWLLIRSLDGSCGEVRRYRMFYDYAVKKLRGDFDRRFVQDQDAQVWNGAYAFHERNSTQKFFMLGSEDVRDASETLATGIDGRKVLVESGTEDRSRPYYYLKGRCWDWRDQITAAWVMRLVDSAPADASGAVAPPIWDNSIVRPLGAGVELRLGAQPDDDRVGPVAHVSLVQQTAPRTMPRQYDTGSGSPGFLLGITGTGTWLDSTTFRADSDDGVPVFSSFLEGEDSTVAERLLVVFETDNPRNRLLLRVEDILDEDTATVSTALNAVFNAFANLSAWVTDIPVADRVPANAGKYTWGLYLWRGWPAGGKTTFPNVFQVTRSPYGGLLRFDQDFHAADLIEVGVVNSPFHYFPATARDVYHTVYWTIGEATVYVRPELGELFTAGMLGMTIFPEGEDAYRIEALTEPYGSNTYRGATLAALSTGAAFNPGATATGVRAWLHTHVVENGVDGILTNAGPDTFEVPLNTSGVELTGSHNVTSGTYWPFNASETAAVDTITAGMKVLLDSDGWFRVDRLHLDGSGNVDGIYLVSIADGSAKTAGAAQGWDVYEVAEYAFWFPEGVSESPMGITTSTLIISDRDANGNGNNGEHVIDDVVAGTELLAPTYPTHRPGAFAAVELSTTTTVTTQTGLSWKLKGELIRFPIEEVLSDTSVQFDTTGLTTEFAAVVAASENGQLAWRHVTQTLELPNAVFHAEDANRKITLDKSGDPELDGRELEVLSVTGVEDSNGDMVYLATLDHIFDAPFLNIGAIRWALTDHTQACVAYVPAATPLALAAGNPAGVYVYTPLGTPSTFLPQAGTYIYIQFPYLDDATALSVGLQGVGSTTLTLAPALHNIPIKVLESGNDGVYGDWVLLDLAVDSPLLPPLNSATVSQVYAWPVNLGKTLPDYVPALYLGNKRLVYSDTDPANWRIFQTPKFFLESGLTTPAEAALCSMSLSTTRQDARTLVTLSRMMLTRSVELDFYDMGDTDSVEMDLAAMARSATPAMPGATFGYRGDKHLAAGGYFLRIGFDLISFSDQELFLAEAFLQDLKGVPELLESGLSPGYDETTLWVGVNQDVQGEEDVGDVDRVAEMQLKRDRVYEVNLEQLDAAVVLSSLDEHAAHQRGTPVAWILSFADMGYAEGTLTLEEIRERLEPWL